MRPALLAAALSASLFRTCLAPASHAAPPGLLPEAGHVSVSLGTGVPFLAIGEVSLGLDEGFALGLVAGVTPVVEGAGVRLRGVLAESGRVSLLFDAPVLYYPDTTTRTAWFLARPALLVDLRIGDAAHVQAGAGVILETSVGREWPDIIESAFQTLRAGGILPVSDHLALFADVGLVFDGLRLAGPEWGGGPPVVAALGLTWTP